MRERRAYIVLVAIVVVLCMATGIFTVVQDQRNNKKFCKLVQASVAVPVVKPKDPKANPSREKLYEDFVIVVNLGHALGCSGIPNL